MNDNTKPQKNHPLPLLKAALLCAILFTGNSSIYAQKILFTIINGTTYRLGIFTQGTYTIKVGELGTALVKEFTGIQSAGLNDTTVLTVELSAQSHEFKPKVTQNSLRKLKIQWNNLTKSVQIDFPLYGNYHIDILRANGEITMSRKVQGSGTYLLSVPGIASGNYFVRVATSKETKLKKVIVIR